MRPTTGDTCLTDICFTCSTVSENKLFFIDLSSYRHKIHNVKQDMPMQGRTQDFKLGGAHLKIFGVFRVKNHDFTPTKHIFSYFRGGAAPGAPRPCNDHYTVNVGSFCSFL